MIIITLLLFIYGIRVFLAQKYQLFGKRAVSGGDARNASLIFVLPFVATILGLAFSAIGAALLVNLFNALSYVFLAIAGTLVGYTAFFAPDSTLEHGKLVLSDTVTTATAASYMNIPEEEVLYLIDTGILQARKVNDEYRIHKEVLIGYFQTKQELAARNT